MREILFRGKSSENGEWIYGSLIKRSIGSFIVDEANKCSLQCCGEYDFHFNSKLVKSETVGQYTGLTDKNGKKIFEGDILNCSSFSGINDFKNCAVKWCDLFLSFRSDKHSLFGDFEQDYEVIGNIHDNPELLKGGG